ncbi:MAG TPA: TIGR03067 domain-containing protein [Gemmatales bacterium]|nr:TIGR03067 domain-containing protein [Gemmatales bacterium]HMP58882.1 TIGR03067 domain-containing protein [Gemmatales bacterium]
MRWMIVLMTALSLMVGGAWGDEDAKKDLDRMQGEWQMVSGEFNGEKFPEEMTKAAKRTVKDDTYTVVMRDEEGQPRTVKGKFKLDATQSPRAIDATTTVEGEEGEAKIVGIYEFTGDDEVRVCMAGVDRGRPKAFDSQQGTLVTWKRVKKE